MGTIKLNTTIGTAEIKKIKGAVKIVTGGLWFNSVLEVAQFTDINERAGVLCSYDFKTGTTTYRRLKCSYMSAESVKKYGRQVVTEVLPLYI